MKSTINCVGLALLGLSLLIPQMGFAKRDRGSDEGHRSRGRIMEQLSPEGADLFQQTMQTLRSQKQSLNESMENLKQQVEETFKAETFDKESFLSLSDQIQQLHQQKKTQFREALADLATQLSQEDRAVLAKMAAHSPHRMHRFRKKRSRGGDESFRSRGPDSDRERGLDEN